MKKSDSALRRLVGVAIIVLIGAAWFMWLRPVALGGTMSYVVVQGESMEPTYEDGDLVLVREEATYGDGDVIAFRAGGTFDDPTRIIHRIVGDDDDGGYRTQGDNRDRLDPWTPGLDDIIGRAVLHVPMAGRAAGFLTQPATFAALGGAAVVVGGERRRRRRRPARHLQSSEEELMHEEPARQTPHRAASTTRLGRMTHPRWAFAGLIASILLAAPILGITWSALRAPDSTQRIERIGQIDYGIGIDYTFSGPPSPVYPTGEVRSSPNPAGAVVPDDPLYSKLLDRLELTLTFLTDDEGADRVASSYDVAVTVETPGGWSTTVDSVEVTPFTGTASQPIEIDLQAVALQVAAVAQLTGVGGDAYTLNVRPTIALSGRSAAGDVQADLTAPVTFEVAGNVIEANAIEASGRTDLDRTVSERATYSVGAFDMGTQAARGLLGGLSLVLVAGIVWFASVLFGGLGLGEPQRIAARYRSQIVDVSAATAPPGPVVMVSAIDELVRIAKVEQTVIVHENLGDGCHRYRVFLGTVTYEYETAPEHAGAAHIASSAAPDETG